MAVFSICSAISQNFKCEYQNCPLQVWVTEHLDNDIWYFEICGFPYILYMIVQKANLATSHW